MKLYNSCFFILPFIIHIFGALIKYVAANEPNCGVLQSTQETLVKLVQEFDNFKKQLDQIEARLKSMQTRIEQKSSHDDSKCVIRDITEAIHNHRFQLAEEKLNELADRKKISNIVHDIYAGAPVNVGVILEFAKGLHNSESLILVLNAVLEEMRSNGNVDPLKLITVVETLEREALKLKDEVLKEKAKKVIENAVEDLKVASVSILKAAMIANKFEMNAEVASLSDALYEFRLDVSYDVMDRIVDSVFGVVSAGKILDNISSQKNIPQVIAGLTAVFNRFNFAGNLNNGATLDLADHIRKVQKREHYSTISQDLKDKIEKVVQQLPTCAKNIFFQDYICIWNKARQQYLYAADTTISYDGERRSIYTWFPGEAKPGSEWFVDKVGDTFFFKNKEHQNEYLYSAGIDHNKDMRYLFTWIPGNNTDAQSAWAVELEGEFCYLKTTFYNEYLFAPNKNYNQLNGYVFTWKPGTLVRSPEFQWQIKSCV